MWERYLKCGTPINNESRIILRGLVQTIFGKINVIVTLGGGGGGGGGGGKLYCPQVLFYNTEHLVSCSVDSSGSSYVYLDYTAH